MTADLGLLTADAEAERELTVVEKLRIMRREGWPQTMSTGRIVRIRPVYLQGILQDEQAPERLRMLVARILTSGNRDGLVLDYLEIAEGSQPPTLNEVMEYLAIIDMVVLATLADETDLAELTLAEKKHLFRFGLGTEELIVTFVYEPQPRVHAAEALPEPVEAMPEPVDI